MEKKSREKKLKQQNDWRKAHPEVNRASVRKWQKKNPNKVKEIIQKFVKNNPEKIKKYSHEAYIKNRDKIKVQHKKYLQTHKKEIYERTRKRIKEARLECLTYYGGGKAACLRCKYDIFDALDLDHIKNDGAKHRPRYGYSWGTFFRKLIKEGFPEGYQTLCRNCNWLKHIENLKEKRKLIKQ